VPVEGFRFASRPKDGAEQACSGKDAFMPRCYYVYILANRWRTLYVGVTNDIIRRLDQHRTGSVVGFTQRYDIDRLVHLESCGNSRDAIAREKQIKNWTRRKKIALIEESNPGWADLAANWFEDGPPRIPRCARNDRSLSHSERA
jgi:putative endonuclease